MSSGAQKQKEPFAVGDFFAGGRLGVELCERSLDRIVCESVSANLRHRLDPPCMHASLETARVCTFVGSNVWNQSESYRGIPAHFRELLVFTGRHWKRLRSTFRACFYDSESTYWCYWSNSEREQPTKTDNLCTSAVAEEKGFESLTKQACVIRVCSRVCTKGNVGVSGNCSYRYTVSL